MRLSSWYRTVTALFDSPVEVTSEGPLTTNFRVGDWEYELFCAETAPGVWKVSFEAQTFLGSLEQKKELIVKWDVRRRWKLEGADPAAIEGYFQSLLRARKFSIMNTGNAPQVIGSVLNLLKQIFTSKPGACLLFSSYDRSRTRLYYALAKRFERQEGGTIQVDSDTGNKAKFTVCLPSKKTDSGS